MGYVDINSVKKPDRLYTASKFSDVTVKETPYTAKVSIVSANNKIVSTLQNIRKALLLEGYQVWIAVDVDEQKLFYIDKVYLRINNSEIVLEIKKGFCYKSVFWRLQSRNYTFLDVLLSSYVRSVYRILACALSQAGIACKNYDWEG